MCTKTFSLWCRLDDQEQLRRLLADPSAGFHGQRIALTIGMNCPLCNIALKAAGHRGVSVNYCPLCGGTWLDRCGFDNLSDTVVTAPRPHRRVFPIVILSSLVLAGCVIAAVAVGAVTLWPAVRSWTEALIGGKPTAVTSQVRQLAGRLGDKGILELGRSGLESAVLSALSGNSAFERLSNSVSAVPNLAPLVQNGAYLKVLQEAARQNVQTLADVKPDKIVSPETRAATEQVQRILRQAPGGGGAAATVDPAILGILKSDAFQQLSRSGIFERFFGGANKGAKVE